MNTRSFHLGELAYLVGNLAFTRWAEMILLGIYACIFEALQDTAIDTSKQRHMDASECSSLQQERAEICFT